MSAHRIRLAGGGMTSVAVPASWNPIAIHAGLLWFNLSVIVKVTIWRMMSVCHHTNTREDGSASVPPRRPKVCWPVMTAGAGAGITAAGCAGLDRELAVV